MIVKTFFTALVYLIYFVASADCQQGKTVPEKISIISAPAQNPVIKRLATNPILRLTIYVPAGYQPVSLRSINLALDAGAVSSLQQLDAFFTDSETLFATGHPLATITQVAQRTTIPMNLELSPGMHTLWLSGMLKESADVTNSIELHCTGLTGAAGKLLAVEEGPGSYRQRIGIAVKKGGEDGVDTYRIPGIVTTDKGTLVAVYDVRYKDSRDLPGNIDVGMSRSTDGGRSWEAMKIVVDMGAPHENNGVGDPSILFDPVTKKIWIAALWSKGNHSIAGSGPGLSPDESGQFVLVSSDDDGRTWSAPVNITAQVKDPSWKILFQGPGSGIAMQDGRLVFPAQYWDGAGLPHATLVWSGDHGSTWKRGVSAKANTTESQLVETAPGTLMLNMRDNRGSFRSIATTTNMGGSWTEHFTSYRSLPDPVCMASLIKARVQLKAGQRDVLFFSNPRSACRRENMTIRASLDLGRSWQPTHQLLIDARTHYGYSTLTRIDEKTVGLLYEGTKDLYFVRVGVEEIVR